MKPPHSHKAFLILAIAVTLLVAARYVYMEWQVNVSVAKAILARDLVIAAQGSKSREQDLLKLYDNTAENRARLKGLFIPSNETVHFIEVMESMGPQSGATLTLSSIAADPLDKAKAGTFGSASAHIDATGSWFEVFKVLKLAENLPYKVYVNNVRLDTSGLPTAPAPAPTATTKTPAAKTKVLKSKQWRISFDVNAVIIAVTSSSTPSVVSTTTKK